MARAPLKQFPAAACISAGRALVSIPAVVRSIECSAGLVRKSLWELVLLCLADNLSRYEIDHSQHRICGVTRQINLFLKSNYASKQQSVIVVE